MAHSPVPTPPRPAAPGGTPACAAWAMQRAPLGIHATTRSAPHGRMHSHPHAFTRLHGQGFELWLITAAPRTLHARTSQPCVSPLDHWLLHTRLARSLDCWLARRGRAAPSDPHGLSLTASLRRLPPRAARYIVRGCTALRTHSHAPLHQKPCARRASHACSAPLPRSRSIARTRAHLEDRRATCLPVAEHTCARTRFIGIGGKPAAKGAERVCGLVHIVAGVGGRRVRKHAASPGRGRRRRACSWCYPCY